MKKFTRNSLQFAALLSATCMWAGPKDKVPASFKPKEETTVCFTENKGQVRDQYNESRKDVLFGGSSKGLNFHFTKNGVSYQLNRIDKTSKITTGNSVQEKTKIDKSTVYRLDLKWVNTNNRHKVGGEKPVSFTSNYILPEGELTAKSYQEVMYNDLYEGIDAKWYDKNGELEYDYIVAPGADPSQIKFTIEGATDLSISQNNELIITTPIGEIVQKAPIATQDGKILESSWTLNNQTVGFNIKGVDPTKALLIDPVVRAWGTYYGGSGSDRGYGCGVDAAGNVYMSGDCTTATSTLIATVGSHQTSFAGNTDGFLVKFNSAGVRQWATYYGGPGNQFETLCAVDAAGNVIIGSYSDNETGTIIATPGTHQPVFSGGVNDAYIAKFNTSGVRQWGTYFGGNGADYIRSICIDATGNIYIAGQTSSNNGTTIATAVAHQTVYGGGSDDGFIAKFDANGLRLWGTYYGGIGQDRAFSIAVDPVSGDLYVSGDASTTGGTVIATVGSHQAVSGGSYDSYLARFSPAGVRQWATYYGGAGNEYEPEVAVDATGTPYLAGYSDSNSGTVIATPGTHQPALAGASDAFLVQFNGSGVRQWGTFFGGAGTELGRCVKTMANGNVVIAGFCNSVAGISTPGSFQSSNAGGDDGFIAIFNSNGIRLSATYYGGPGNERIDRGSSLAVTNSGYIFVNGMSPSGNTLASPGSHQAVNNGGGYDAFLVKFNGEGAALNLDGTAPGDAVLLPAAISTSLSGLNKITVEAWVRTTSMAGLGCIIGNYTLPNNQMQFLLRRESTAFRFWIGNSGVGSYTPVISAASPTLNAWSHVAGVWDGAVGYIYVDGVLSGTTAVTYTSLGVTTNSTMIGINSINENFTGDIDEVRIWNRALCITEIQNNMNAELSLPQSGLMAYYKFNQGVAAGINTSVTTLADSGPNAYTGTLSGIALSGVTSNWTAPGAVVTTFTAPVYVSPTLAIAGATAICNGNTVTLTASGPVTSYSWVSGPTTASNAVSPTVTTTYSVWGTNSVGCLSSPAMQTLVVNALPVVTANSGSICLGSSFTITPGGASTYTIQGGNAVVSPTSTAAYTVIGTSTAGCVSSNVATSNVTVVVCSGMNELNSVFEGSKLYPNPAKGIVSLDLSVDAQLSLTDLTGRVMMNEKVVAGKNNLNISTLTSGVYFVKLKKDDSIMVYKLIVE